MGLHEVVVDSLPLGNLRPFRLPPSLNLHPLAERPVQPFNPVVVSVRFANSYSKYVVQRMEDLKLAKYDRDYDPKSYFPEAIYAYFDDESGIFRIYTTEPLNPWMELPQFSRAAIGSGGIAGTVFLKTAEDYMEHFGLGWKNFSTKAVSHFLWIVMRRISNIDPFSSGIKIYRLGTEKTTELRFDEADDSLSSLTKDIVADLSPVKTKEILDKIDLANILKGLGLG